MARTYTGIDIGSSQVKFAVCDAGGDIRRIAVAAVPEQLVRDGRIVSPEAMSDFLCMAARQHKIRNRDCAVILPAALVFSRRLTVPLMTEEQLKINLPYEFRDFITQEKDKYFYDYAVAGIIRNDAGQEVELDLMAAATLKSTIANYSAMLRRAGFKLCIAAPVEFAYGNLLRRYEAAHPPQVPRETCVIDIGHTATRIQIFTGCRFEVTRVIDYGCTLLDTAIADELHVDGHIAATYKIMNHNDVQALESCRNIYHNIAIEIMRAINFYGFNNPGSHLADAYYCGGGARITLLLEDIAATIGLTLHSMEELMPGGGPDREHLLACPAAVGITQQ